MNHFFKPRFWIVLPLVVWAVLAANTTEVSLRLGTLVVLLGEVLRFWSNGYVGHVKVNWTSLNKNGIKVGRLVTAGPYAFVRNPLYFGTFVIAAGFCMAIGNPWFGLVTLCSLLVVYQSKIQEEEVDIAHEGGEVYRSYRKAVPRLLPTLRRYPDRQGRFSWQGIKASKEWKTVIWVTVFLIALYIREETFEEHGFLVANQWVKHVALLSFMVILAAADGLLELIHRLRG